MTRVPHTRSDVDCDSMVANVGVSRNEVSDIVKRRAIRSQRSNGPHLGTSSCRYKIDPRNTSRSYVGLVEDCKTIPRSASLLRNTRKFPVSVSGYKMSLLDHDTRSESCPSFHGTRMGEIRSEEGFSLHGLDDESYLLARDTRTRAPGSKERFSVDGYETALRVCGSHRAVRSSAIDLRRCRNGLRKHQGKSCTKFVLVHASWILRKSSLCSCLRWCYGVHHVVAR